MEITLNTAEIASVLKRYVAEKYNVKAGNAYTIVHTSTTELAKYGKVCVVIECESLPAGQITPDLVGQRQLDANL